ncbi:FHA domain-containing protein At4g14490 [Sorghum bicolor]|uniref:FHA domain-containing protein At4g14490 n=1 Tax=Sorghum bicolor TaxID=4558 RepID=UPI0001A823FC|nr:FHA domain-containing protein At4g14490 [Sorghum bicolor]|eukprot:XP_002463937.1 FHA domain-containing protein At4g14490 [Sorghum bicolor]
MVDPPSVLTLLVKKGPCEGKTLQRRAGAAALRVGRVAKGNHLPVGDAGASQRHFSVEFLPPPAARWAVTDLGSSNGTLLNGTPLVATIPAPLSDGDLIKIGETTVLAVSISTDAGPGPGPGPAATRRSARNASAAAEEQGPAVSRRAGRRKAGVAEAPKAVNEVEEEAALPTRRGGRKKAGAAEAPEAGHEVEEEAALPTRRGGRKKAGAMEAPEAGNKVEEEAALPSRRGGLKKAVEPAGVETEAEDEEGEAAIPSRVRSRKAAVTFVLPPQPQNTRSARAAARRGEVLGCENDEEEVVRTGRGRGRVTRASARNRTDVTPEEEEEEGEVAVTRDQEGTTAEGKGEMVPAGRGRAKRGRGGRGRGRATRARTKKAEDAIVENDENEQEEKDMADGRERVGSPLRVLAVNDCSEEDKVAAEDDKLDGNSKASVEDKMVDVEEEATLTERAIEGRAQHAPADNGGVEEEEVKNLSKGGETELDQELREKVSPGSKLDGVGEVEKNDNREAIGASGEKGHEGERKGRRRLEDMTLGEWFVQMEKYLLAKNAEAAEKAIAEVQEKHRRFCEHVKSLNLKKSPAP